MPFQNRSSQEMMSEINVTPLVDVMLVLLVVFIVTAPLLTQSVGVSLPKVAATGVRGKVLPHQLSIDAGGGMRLNDVLVSESDLTAQLTRLARPDLELQIDADTQVVYGKVARVMAIAQRAGVEKLVFVSNALPGTQAE